MQYVCLVYVDSDVSRRMTAEEAAALDEASLASDEELRESGHLVLAQALQRVEEAITVRVRDGRMSATAGPFAETTEQLGGLIFVEARDLNEAVQLAARIPLARLGSIEVRPVMDLAARVRERRAR